MSEPQDDDLVVVYRDPARLRPYAGNARIHSPEQVRQIRRSIDEFGFRNPILLKDDEETIGAGHGRQLASLLKPALARVPTIVCRGLSDEQWRALVIADNRIAENAGWDDALLKLELEGLATLGFDLSLTGFSSADLTSIFATQEGNTDPDDVPETPAVPTSRVGDLWRLGEHRLIVGDCTSKEVVDRVLSGHRPVLCSTDSPYGVEYSPDWRTKALQDGAQRAEGRVRNDDRADWREAWKLFPGDVIYVWHDGSNPAATQLALEAAGFEVRSQIIWRKSSMAVGRGHYHWAHESAMYAVRKGSNAHWAGSRKETTVWDIESPKRSETGHGTQKPVECMARPIRHHTAPGELVFDGFLGSGTTLIAAHMNKRLFAGCEIDPSYADVSVLRWMAFAGAEAVLEETGETFAAVKARRAADVEVV